MATAKPQRLPPRPGARPRRWSRVVLVWVALAVVVALVLSWPTLRSYGRTGASYGARVGCSCHFIGGRGLSDCRKDFEPGMGLVVLSADKVAKSVTARFPLVSTQTATYRPGEGCVLDKWND
ncbi:MAG: hypothetical protein KGL44_04255 [Sphingomonadales bacterium]|nr:hypothetical protein [Sphingomonadales bacterium]